MQKINKHRPGFTLIELVVVVSLIVIIFTIVFVILDPDRRVAEARNSERQTHLKTIGDAVKTFQVDHKGSLPPGIDETLRMLGTDPLGCDISCSVGGVTTTSCLDMSSSLTNTYVASIPFDPLTGNAGKKGYAIQKVGGKAVEVFACAPEREITLTYIR